MKDMEARMKYQDEKMMDQDEKMKAQAVASDDFGKVTAQAISALAEETVSGFKPAARASITDTRLQSIGKNSIFQSLRKQAGLAK